MAAGPDKRREERQEIVLKLTYESEGEFYQDYTHNISRGGLFFGSDDPLPMHTVVQIKLVIPGVRVPLQVPARVVHIIPANGINVLSGMGLEILDIPPAIQTLIDLVMEKIKG